MTEETWMCERHPGQPWEHGGCGGAGMLLNDSFRLLDAIARISDEPGAIRITREESGPFCVEVVTYQNNAEVAERLPEPERFRYEHETLIGALVTASLDVWPAVPEGGA